MKIFLLIFSIVFLVPFITAETYPIMFANRGVPSLYNVFQNGRFDSSLFTGAAIYSYPLKLPPGTNDLVPELSLSYNNHNSRVFGSDILGTGWSITQNYIERDINYTVVDQSDDKFRLILGGRSYDLIYDPNEGQFHTKIESFLHIENKSGADNEYGNYWIVKDKSGKIYRFGFNNNSELASNWYLYYTVRWSLDLVTDPYNNSIFYNYSEDPYVNDTGVVYPVSIEYNNDKSRKIEFSLESSIRKDLYGMHKNGNREKRSRRLEHIIIYDKGNIVRRYYFQYNNLEIYDGITLLSNITEHGTDNQSSLPLIQFGYKTINKGMGGNNDTWQPPGCFVKRDGVEDGGYLVVDVNGDGLDDILFGKQDSGGGCGTNQTEAWINTGEGFTYIHAWRPPKCFIDKTGKKDLGLRIGDVNGDGLVGLLHGRIVAQDDCIHEENKQIYLNTGEGWAYNSTWALPGAACFATYEGDTDRGYRLVDVNGDGLVDILNGKIDRFGSCDKYVMINNGNDWVNTPSWVLPGCFANHDGDEDMGYRLADVNGDNLIDVLYGREGTNDACTPDTHSKVYINTGGTWYSDTNWNLPGCFVGRYGKQDMGYRITDVNGDGLTDILWGKETSDSTCGDNQKKGYINEGTRWYNDDSWEPPSCFVGVGGQENWGYRLAELNGDGLTDMLFGKQAVADAECGDTQKTARINKASKTYLLANITDSFGGITYIDYIPSTSLDNTGGDNVQDLGFNMWLVSNITKDNQMNDSHKEVYTKLFNYSSGLYDPIDKEFRGFRYVSEALNEKETDYTFYQDAALAGRGSKVNIMDDSGLLYQTIISTWNYTTNGSYYIPYLNETSEISYNTTSAILKTKNTSYNYDDSGNLIEIHYKGDVDNYMDDRYEYFTYLYNTSAWIIDKVKNSSLFDFNNTKIEATFYLYDNLSYGTAPEKGSITSKEDWLDNGDNPVSNYSYDSYGNLVISIDALGRVTQQIYGLYDTTYTFANKIINPLGHVVEQNYSLGSGNPLWQKDSNGVYKNYTYDIFGRVVKEIMPYDTLNYPTKEYIYAFDGIAPEKVMTKIREISLTNETYDQYSFYDGFNNLIQTKKEGDHINQITEDLYYDENGRVETQTNPYLIIASSNYSELSQTISNATTTYDPLDRPKVITNPDNTIKNFTYFAWNVTMYDENDHRKGQALDAYGQIIYVKEYNSDENYTTQYNYDAAGNLIEIIDNENNAFDYIYDSLSRRIQMNDPDFGTWNYTYDLIGNLIMQIDNKGEAIIMDYDDLNRIENKSSQGSSFIYTYDVYMNNTLSSTKSDKLIVNYSYDNRLRKIEEIKVINGLAFVLNYGYDSMDRITSQVLPNNEIISYTYGNNSKISLIANIANFSYNERGQTLERNYSNSLNTEFVYNESNFRLDSINTENLQNLSYEYDSVGNVMGIADTANNVTTSMTYDDLDRLIFTNLTDKYNDFEKIINFSYNSIGNLLNVLINDRNISYYYNGSLAHAPSSYADSDYSNAARIDLDLIYPMTHMNVTQNEFFNVTVNVTCRNSDCGEINVSLDPENHEYTRSTETHCKNGVCSKTLYSGIRFVHEDNQWKKVENARSLKDKGFEVVYLKNDPSFIYDNLDYNYTAIWGNLSFNGNWEDYPDFCHEKFWGNDVKCKFNLKKKYQEWNGELEDYEDIEYEYEFEWEFEDGIVTSDKLEFKIEGNPFEKKFKFGGNSTTIMLQDADTENLGDASADEYANTTNYGTENYLWTQGHYGTSYGSGWDAHGYYLNITSVKIYDNQLEKRLDEFQVRLESCLNVTNLYTCVWNASNMSQEIFCGPAYACSAGSTIYLPAGFTLYDAYYYGFKTDGGNVTISVDDVEEIYDYNYSLGGDFVELIDVSLDQFKARFDAGIRESFIKFNLSNLLSENLIEARFNVYKVTAFSRDVRVSNCSGSWTEDTITWNNKVASCTNLDLISSSAAEWLDFNVTSGISLSKDTVTFKLDRNEGVYSSQFRSKEYSTASQRPYLNITYIEGSKSGLISTIMGDTPFYTNESNPRTINLSLNESQLVTFWVNATGGAEVIHKFFVFANLTSSMSIGNITSKWDVTISDPIPDDTSKFYIKNNQSDPVVWLGSSGNMVLEGNCSSQTTCVAPSNSFIIRNSTDETTAYIDMDGNLCVENGDCSDLSADCDIIGGAFKIRNSTGSIVSYISFDGDLCLTGGLYENVEM